MQRVAITGAAVFSLLLVVVIAGYAQHGQEGPSQEGRKQDHALRQQERHQQESGHQPRPSDHQQRQTRSREVRE
jgi:hypothetical protein